MIYTKETDNTHVYKHDTEDGQPTVIGTLYVQKWVYGRHAPKKLRITIEEA